MFFFLLRANKNKNHFNSPEEKRPRIFLLRFCLLSLFVLIPVRSYPRLFVGSEVYRRASRLSFFTHYLIDGFMVLGSRIKRLHLFFLL
jgi:hypothetical protein